MDNPSLTSSHLKNETDPSEKENTLKGNSEMVNHNSSSHQDDIHLTEKEERIENQIKATKSKKQMLEKKLQEFEMKMKNYNSGF